MNEAAKQILVVDDDPLILQTLKLYLEMAGHAVSVATNGADAISHLRGTTPDVIILDIFMPDMDGFETLLHIRREDRRSKVLVISGGGSSVHCDFLSIATKLGADLVLRKPFTRAQFIECVEGLGEPAAG